MSHVVAALDAGIAASRRRMRALSGMVVHPIVYRDWERFAMAEAIDAYEAALKEEREIDEQD